MDVNVCLYEDGIVDLASLSPGMMTYRNIFNAFRNDWFIKIKVNGKTLKKLVIPAMNADEDSKKTIVTPVVEGIAFTDDTTDNNKPTLLISEISDNQYYTVAVPEKLLNGNRLGTIILDYEIIQQIHLMFLLKQHFKKHAMLDFDKQLASLKPRLI